jgi:CubicO group peptidase (beta-lactamase class C family)
LARLEARDSYYGGVGGAAVLRLHGELVLSGAWGLADLEQGVPVSPDESRFQVASVTKAVTAAAALLLNEEGRLDLDAPVTRYLDGFPKGPGVTPTVRLLAGHLGGIRHYRPDERDANFFAQHFENATEALTRFSDDPYAGQPGEEFRYSSYGYDLIAAVIESVVGRPYEDFVTERLFRPLGLDRTGFDDIRYPLSDRVRGYTYYFPWFSFETTERIRRAPELDLSYNPGGGNIVSTATDLARFGEAFVKPGFLRVSSLELVRTPVRIGEVTSPWGFGWQISEGPGGGTALTAEGSVPGFQATVRVYPEAEAVAVHLVNSWGLRPPEPHPIQDPLEWMVEECTGG